MGFNEIIAVSGTILASLGGGAGIIFACSNRLGKVWADRLMMKEKARYGRELEELKSRFVRETEKYKVQLKKSEFLFEKEYVAGSELVALILDMTSVDIHPDVEYDDLCDYIAFFFEANEKKLDQFLAKHGAVLKDDVKEMISRCRTIAGLGKCDITSPEVPRSANKAADELYKLLKQAEKELIGRIHSQSAI